MRGLLRTLGADGHASRAEAGYRCTGCGARWSYEAVRYVALCPECASGLVRVTEPEVAARSGPGRRTR